MENEWTPCPDAENEPSKSLTGGELLKQIERLSAAATPGEWNIGTEVRGSEICTVHGVPPMPTEDGLGQEWLYIEHPRIIDGDWHWPTPEAKLANARLIVALRNAVPEILTALRAQQHAEAMADVLEEVAGELEAEVEAKRGSVLPRTTERDLLSVRSARAALAAYRSVK